jgi:hypothetical protein
MEIRLSSILRANVRERKLMRGQNADRAIAGRHTLDPASGPSLDSLTTVEPLCTIYVKRWYAARERGRVAEGPQRQSYLDLLDVVESGWLAVRDLQHWFESNHARARQKDAYGHLLAFVAGDLVDVYRDFAGGVADLVPGWDGWDSEADPDGVLGDVDTFERYMALLNLAARVAEVPEQFAALVESVAARMSALGPAVEIMVSTLWSEDERD